MKPQIKIWLFLGGAFLYCAFNFALYWNRPRPEAEIAPLSVPANLISRNFELIRVIDGDTIVGRVDLGMDIFVVKTVRILGVNAPEMRGSSPEEKISAQKSKDFVEKQLNRGENLRILSDDKPDKYGRLLGDIVYEYRGEKRFLAQQLFANELAVEYNP